MEIGPYRVREGGKLAYNDGSWDEFANVLFVDNPVGTGFSYVDTDSYVHELKDMADQFLVFLEKFFTIFPEYSHDDVSTPISTSSAYPVWLISSSSTFLASHMQAHTSRTLPERSSTATK